MQVDAGSRTFAQLSGVKPIAGGTPPAPLASVYAALGVYIAVQGGIKPGFALLLDTPDGEVCFTG